LVFGLYVVRAFPGPSLLGRGLALAKNTTRWYTERINRSVLGEG
jgi:hypothetical protein